MCDHHVQQQDFCGVDGPVAVRGGHPLQEGAQVLSEQVLAAVHALCRSQRGQCLLNLGEASRRLRTPKASWRPVCTCLGYELGENHGPGLTRALPRCLLDRQPDQVSAHRRNPGPPSRSGLSRGAGRPGAFRDRGDRVGSGTELNGLELRKPRTPPAPPRALRVTRPHRPLPAAHPLLWGNRGDGGGAGHRSRRRLQPSSSGLLTICVAARGPMGLACHNESVFLVFTALQ